jgi:hypothetical protein
MRTPAKPDPTPEELAEILTEAELSGEPRNVKAPSRSVLGGDPKPRPEDGGSPQMAGASSGSLRPL